MRDLEDLLRQQSQEPRPGARPPVGGFESVQRRMATLAAPSIGNRQWSTFLLLAGLGGLIILYFYPSHRQVSVQLTAFPMVASPVAEAVVAPSSSTDAPVAAIRLLPPSEFRVQAGEEALVSAMIRKVAKPRVLLTEAGEEQSVPSGSLSRPPVIPIPQLVALQYAVVPVPVHLPTPRPQRQRRARGGSWELRLNAYPNRNPKRYYPTSYTTRPPAPGFPGSGFVQDGELRLFYYAQDHEQERRSSSPILQLQLNRRTPFGLFYGLGLTYFQDNAPGRRVARPLVSGNDVYASYRDRKYNLILGSAQLGYARPLGRHWDAWVGAGVQIGLRRETYSAYRLVGATGDWMQLESRTVDYPLNGSEKMPLIPSLELGIRYRVLPAWHLGLTVGTAPTEFAGVRPTLGLDAVRSW